MSADLEQLAHESHADAAGLGVAELVAWLALVAAVAAFVAWGFAGGLQRKAGASPLVAWTVSIGLGVAAGVILGAYTPVESELVGGLVGLGAGASPAWIVQRIKARASRTDTSP